MKNNFSQLMIELTNTCNLRCPICPTGENYNGEKRGVMSFERLKQIVEPVKSHVTDIRLYNFGESFLVPDFVDIVKYLNDQKITLTIHTNGNIKDPTKIDIFKKISTNVKIFFSIDGISQNTYSFYRKRGNLKLAMKNMQNLVDIKKANKLSNIVVVWQFLIMKENVGDVDKVKEMAKKIGVDILAFKTISINENHPRYDEFVPTQRKYQRVKTKNAKKEKMCNYIDPGCPTVLWDGRVVACCIGPAKKHVFGNAFSESLASIWDKPVYKDFRDDFANGKNNFCNSYCRRRETFKVFSDIIDFRK